MGSSVDVVVVVVDVDSLLVVGLSVGVVKAGGGSVVVVVDVFLVVAGDSIKGNRPRVRSGILERSVIGGLLLEEVVLVGVAAVVVLGLGLLDLLIVGFPVIGFGVVVVVGGVVVVVVVGAAVVVVLGLGLLDLLVVGFLMISFGVMVVVVIVVVVVVVVFVVDMLVFELTFIGLVVVVFVGTLMGNSAGARGRSSTSFSVSGMFLKRGISARGRLT